MEPEINADFGYDTPAIEGCWEAVKDAAQPTTDNYTLSPCFDSRHNWKDLSRKWFSIVLRN